MVNTMSTSEKSKQVVKLNGDFEEFQPLKISNSIWMAAQKVGGNDKELSYQIGEEVIETLTTRYPNGGARKTLEIGELVEKFLIEKGHATTAQEFIRYRENKKNFRQDK